jgi:hypothetical protein
MNITTIIYPSYELYRFKDSAFRFRNVNKTASSTVYAQWERKRPPETRTVEVPSNTPSYFPIPRHTHNLALI